MNSPPTLKHCYETVYRPARHGNASPSTTYQYKLNLDRFAKFLGHEPTTADLTDGNVSACAAWLEADQKLSPASAVKFLDNVTALWRHLCLTGLVAQRPLIEKRRPPVRIPEAWNGEQLKQLWAYLQRMPGEIAGVPANLWWMSLHSIIWDSGERITAVMNTKWSDVDLTGGWVVIRYSTRKGGMADKLSKLHPETIALLRKIVTPRRELVFPWPATPTYIFKFYGEILARAGLPNHRMSKFHKLRKSVATYSKRAGLNPSEILGHYDPKITEQVYIDPRLCPKQHAADALPRLWDVDTIQPAERIHDAKKETARPQPKASPRPECEDESGFILGAGA